MAKGKGATVTQRFQFAAKTVIAYDKKLVQSSHLTRFAADANALLKEQELKLSPTYCYVVARLGMMTSKIGSLHVKAAKSYYESKHDGVSANVYARVLLGHPDMTMRAAALPYALEAQSKQPEMVKIRWMVGGSYYFKALQTKEKSYWQAAIREYERALEFAKLGKDRDFSQEDLQIIKIYLEKARKEAAR